MTLPIRVTIQMRQTREKMLISLPTVSFVQLPIDSMQELIAVLPPLSTLVHFYAVAPTREENKENQNLKAIQQTRFLRSSYLRLLGQ